MFKKLVYILTSIGFVPFTANGNSPLDSTTFGKLYDSAWYYNDIQDYNRALQVLKQLENKVDINDTYQIERLPKLLNLMGACYEYKGNYWSSMEYYKKAIAYTTDTALKAVIYMNMGISFTAQGEFTKAINYYNNALILAAKDDVFDVTAHIYYNYGYTYLKGKKWREAIYSLRKCIEFENITHSINIGYTYLNFALAYQSLNYLDSASYYFQKSLEFIKRGFGVSYIYTAYCFMNYADFLSERGMFSQSNAYIEQAHYYFSKNRGSSNNDFSLCYKYYGNLYYRQKRFDLALQYYHKAFIYKIKDFNSTDIYSLPKEFYYPDIDIVDLLNRKAMAFEKLSYVQNQQKNLLAALECTNQSAGMIEKLRQAYLSEGSKLQITGNESEVYSTGLRVAAKLYELTGETIFLEKAFGFSERSKHGILHELRSDINARVLAGIPNTLMEQERNLLRQIEETRIFVKQENNTEKPMQLEIDKAESRLFHLIREQEKLVSLFESKYPDYYRLKYSVAVTTPDVLKNTLSKDQALLEYSLQDSLIYIFLLTKDTFCLLKSKPDTAFYRSLAFVKKFLHLNYSLEYDVWRKASYMLYQNLIVPVGPYIASKELIIVPDNRLSLISFESFTTEPYTKNKFHMYEREPYLLYKYATGYALSATLLMDSKPKGAPLKGRFIGFAPDYKNSPDSLTDMPEAITSMRKLAFLFFGRSFTGKNANEDKLSKLDRGYKIIQFIAHGLEDTLNPELSKIVLSQGKGPKDDGYLYAHEISSMRINTELVALISCYSGSGKVLEGEGVLSIGRSFFNAGASSMVQSSWAANTWASISIMNGFYWNLIRGDTKIEAMRKAKIKYISKSNTIEANPRHWSSLIVVGNPNPLFKNYILKVSLVAALLVSLIIGIVLFRKKLF